MFIYYFPLVRPLARPALRVRFEFPTIVWIDTQANDSDGQKLLRVSRATYANAP